MAGPAPIFLTGFMATGKSRIGRLLADRLGRPFYDTDKMVEEQAGQTVPEIFACRGEEGFRELESACVREAAALDGAVVALGGGAITRSENREAIREAGAVLVCVEADVESILQRLSRKEDRPLLAGLTPDQRRRRIEEMLAERAPFYGAAHITVRTSEETAAEEVAGGLARRLEERVP